MFERAWRKNYRYWSKVSGPYPGGRGLEGRHSTQLHGFGPIESLVVKSELTSDLEFLLMLRFLAVLGDSLLLHCGGMQYREDSDKRLPLSGVSIFIGVRDIFLTIGCWVSFCSSSDMVYLMMGIVNVNCSLCSGHSGIIGGDHCTRNCLPPVFGRRVSDIVFGCAVYLSLDRGRVYRGLRRGRRVRARCENCRCCCRLQYCSRVRLYSTEACERN